MNKPRIGFVGLGLMGHGIAKNLVTKGFPLTVRVHRNRKPLDDLLAAGAKEVKTNADVARDVRHRVPVRDRRTAGRGDRLRQGRHRVRPHATGSSSSTRRPASLRRPRRCARNSRANGVRFVDAPLARTPVEAEQGRLNIMVGADDATFAELKPVLAAFCENIIHAGPPGHGHHAEAHQQFHRAGDRHGDGRGPARPRRSPGRRSQAARSDLGGRRQLRHLPDDRRQDARQQRRPDRPQVHAGQCDEGPALLHAFRRVAAGVGIVGEAVHQSLVNANLLGFGDKYVASLVEAQEKLTGVAIVPR